MVEFQQAAVTMAFTVLGGVAVFVVGQVLLKVVLEPVQGLRMLIGEVADDLVFHSNVFANPGAHSPEREMESSLVLRQRATQLAARAHLVPHYRVWAYLGIVPSLSNIAIAREGLVYLSNAVSGGDPDTNLDKRDVVQEALRIRDELR